MCLQILQNGADVPNPAHVMAELSAKLGRTFDAQAWSIVAEAEQGNRGGVQAELTSEGSFPLPVSVMARARALSAPYEITGDRLAKAGRMLSERLADFRQPAVARRDQTTPSGAVGKRAESKKATPDFVDDAQAAGLRFYLESGHTNQQLIPETTSGGVGLIDFDGDGWLDVYCVQGGALTDAPGAREPLDRPSAIGCFGIAATAHLKTSPRKPASSGLLGVKDMAKAWPWGIMTMTAGPIYSLAGL